MQGGNWLRTCSVPTLKLLVVLYMDRSKRSPLGIELREGAAGVVGVDEVVGVDDVVGVVARLAGGVTMGKLGLRRWPMGVDVWFCGTRTQSFGDRGSNVL